MSGVGNGGSAAGRSSTAYLYQTLSSIPFNHEMKRHSLALKARVSVNCGNTSERKQDWQSPALDYARTVCQLLSNLGSGAINVPGLQAAGQVGMQIIDIIKVSRLKLVIVALVIKIAIRRKQKETRPTVKTS